MCIALTTFAGSSSATCHRRHHRHRAADRSNGRDREQSAASVAAITTLSGGKARV